MKLNILLTFIIAIANHSILNAKDVTIDYKVSGMMCKMNCPELIKQEASKINGIKKCDVNFNDSKTTIVFDDEKIDKNQISEMLGKATYFDIALIEDTSKKSFWDWLLGK